MSGNLKLKQTTFWAGLGLFIIGSLGLAMPPETMPGWWQRAWGMTFPYTVHGPADQVDKPAVRAQIWTGHGLKGVGGSTNLDLKQLATREEAADADARVDGRSAHRGYSALMALVGLLLMLRPWWEEKREDAADMDEAVNPGPQQGVNTGAQSNPESTHRTTWWERFWAWMRDPYIVYSQRPRTVERYTVHRRTVHTTVLPPNTAPVMCAGCRCVGVCQCQCCPTRKEQAGTLKVTFEAYVDSKMDTPKAKHVVTAELPSMVVNEVYVYLEQGSGDTLKVSRLEVK